MSGYTAPHCGSLREADVDREVDLYGWVARRRDQGGLIFIDLRDRWGKVQVVFNATGAPAAHAGAQGLRNEFVVHVKGRVQKRLPGAENARMATGNIELAASALEVLREAEPVPIQVDEEQEVDEKTRLKYRYLDLRKPAMLRNLEIRHRVNKIIHSYFDEREFIEVETPMLAATSPGGARDFLVPSRLHAGDFYALPQSPQVLKQILMVAGIQRYYQVARCFRDENLRADRQPEFTQLDVEMSFCEEEDVFGLTEGLLARIWKEVLDVDLVVPFPRLDIKESLLRYGTDKPDLRFDLEIADLGAVLKDTEAQVFRGVLEAGGVVRGMAVPGGLDLSRRELDELNILARGAGGQGVADVPGGLLDKRLSEQELMGILEATRAGPQDKVLIVADKRRRAEKIIGLLRTEIARRRGLIRGEDWKFLWINPTYLFDEDDEGRLTYAHHPFTRPVDEDFGFVAERPYDVRGHAYDIVCNGYELGGGSLRIYDAGMQERVFGILGLDRATIHQRFGYLLEAFAYGVPPHGGIAWGIDRVVMMLAGTDNIRDVIAFPKTQSMTDLMMDAPSPVDPAQLDELGIIVKPRSND